MPNFIDDVYLKNNTSKKLIDGLRFTIIISLILTLLIMPVSSNLISLYGNQYISEKWLIAVFTISALAYAPVNLVTNYAYAQKKHKLILIIFSIWFIFTTSICAIFVYLNKELTVYSAVTVQIITNTLLSLILIKKIKNNLL
jgi:O-antigen/teichoic acid export membrane protein